MKHINNIPLMGIIGLQEMSLMRRDGCFQTFLRTNAAKQCALDLSGRSYLAYGLEIPSEKIGDFDSELVEEFFLALTRNAGITLHLKQLDGRNSHHIAEAAFKAFARALREAISIDESAKDEIPSTKGVL